MVRYGLINFLGYEDKNQAVKFAKFSQMVDNPDLDANSIEYKMFEYGNNRELYYQVTIDREDIEELISRFLLARVVRIISYEPIITPRIKLSIDLGAITIEDVMRGQVLMEDDDIFVDQFGLPVFSQNLLVLNHPEVQDQDWRFIKDWSNVIVEGDVKTFL